MEMPHLTSKTGEPSTVTSKKSRIDVNALTVEPVDDNNVEEGEEGEEGGEDAEEKAASVIVQLSSELLGDFPGAFDLFDPIVDPILTEVHGLKPNVEKPAFLAGAYRGAIKWYADHPRSSSAFLDVGQGDQYRPQCACPMWDDPYPIEVFEVSTKKDVTLAGTERPYPCKADKTAEGLQAQLKIEPGGKGCFVDTGKGTLKIHKVWQGAQKEALYECFIEMNMKHSDTIRRKGLG